MPTYHTAFYQIKSQLSPLYDEREAVAIGHELLEHLTGLGKTERLVQKNMLLTEEQSVLFERYLAELAAGMPVQYVVGKAWFMSKEYLVNNAVLIPRPETEELVAWMIEDLYALQDDLAVLDIGTGSGCIPIALKQGLPRASIASCDISEAALGVARQNVARYGVAIGLLHMDFLNVDAQNNLGGFNVIVSNPPYIPAHQRETLHRTVRDFEPETALFVPDEDPLLFYKAIARFGKTHLLGPGIVYCELDAPHADMCKALFENEGYDLVVLKNDMQGRPRMLKAVFSRK